MPHRRSTHQTKTATTRAGSTEAEGPRPLGSSPLWWQLLWQAIALAGCFAISWSLHTEGWFPWDEGQLAQCAERVLNGELPHRDFDEMYTGALTYWHALSFLVFGERIVSTRYFMLLAGFAFAAVYYRLLLRCCSPPLAAAVCMVAVGSSVAVWPSGVPTWYLLFCTTFGTWSLIRYSETQRWYWLLWAGFWAGLAVTIKITGLYGIAAGLLIVTVIGRHGSETVLIDPAQRYLRRAWRSCVAGGLVLCVLLLLQRHFEPQTLAYIGIPAACAAIALLAFDESRYAALRGVDRRVLVNRYSAFLVGVAIPIGVFMIPWVASNSLAALWHGVFVLPRVRLEHAYEQPPPLVHALFGLPLFWLAWPGGLWPRRWGAIVPLALLATLVTMSYVTAHYAMFEVVVGVVAWRSLLPLTAPILVLLLFFTPVLNRERHEWQFILLCTAALFWLNQYPYSNWVYSLFCLPLVMLYAVTLINRPQTGGGPAMWSVLLLVAIYSTNRYYDAGMFLSVPPKPREKLELPRGGLTVWRYDVQMYRPLIAAIQKQVGAGSPILAGPDCPEVYFLSDRVNLTRTIYDIFDSAPNREARLLRLIDDHRLGCVVLNQVPAFSATWSDDLQQEIGRRYRRSDRFGRFVLFTGFRDENERDEPAKPQGIGLKQHPGN